MNHNDFVIPGLRKLNPEIRGLKIVPGLESLRITSEECTIDAMGIGFARI